MSIPTWLLNFGAKAHKIGSHLQSMCPTGTEEEAHENSKGKTN